MKKTYIQPEIKTRKITISSILQASTVSLGSDKSGTETDPVEGGAKRVTISWGDQEDE